MFAEFVEILALAEMFAELAMTVEIVSFGVIPSLWAVLLGYSTAVVTIVVEGSYSCSYSLLASPVMYFDSIHRIQVKEKETSKTL